MAIRDTFNFQRSKTSVVRRKALRCATLLLVLPFSGDTVAAKQSCIDLLAIGKQSIDLDACRPAPVSAEEKRIALKSLPAAGEVHHLSRSQQQKMKDLTAVLRVHQRDGVYEIKIISVPQAWTGLYGRAVLLISLRALELLRSEELQALVAHEAGHEYVWEEYAASRAHDDVRRSQKLELACDAVAVLTLERIGINPNRLITGLEKVSWYNREHFGWAMNEKSYPPLSARRSLVKAMWSANRQKSQSRQIAGVISRGVSAIESRR